MLLPPFVARLACHGLGYLYPAYQSYKAVKTNDPALHTQWLMYWCVSTYFSFVEAFGDRILSWVPLYYEAKVALLIWLVTPYFKGATKIYDRLLAPYLHQYEKDIDGHLENVKHRSAKELGNLGVLGMRQLRSQSNELMKLGQQVLVRHMSGEFDVADPSKAARLDRCEEEKDAPASASASAPHEQQQLMELDESDYDDEDEDDLE